MPKKLGVTTLFLEISCAVDQAKLPNLVNVVNGAIVGLKNESLATTAKKTL